MAQGRDTSFEGSETFRKLLKLADEKNWKGMSIGAIMGAVAFELQGVPYVASTLELHDTRESCVVNLTGLDCVTLFENALGFARMLKTGGRTEADLLAQVRRTRYRGGKMTDYASRLHYTTDWLHDNEKKGTVRLISHALPGAEKWQKRLDFMSRHPQSYRQLKANPAMVKRIAEHERSFTGRTFYYVPKDKIAAAEPMMQTGDIVGITTSVDGLDISHTGLCYRDKDRVLRFLHASSTKKQVILDVRLSEYVMPSSKSTGVMIARPLNP
jgi:hypothetical protein